MSKINLSITILLVLVFQNMAMWSATTDVFPVSLYYKSTPVLGGILKPSKAPAKHHSWSICVYLDETNQNLELFSTSNETISYYLSQIGH